MALRIPSVHTGEISVRPDRPLHVPVRVVFADGSPAAGVRVAVRGRAAQVAGAPPGLPLELCTADTDSTGNAVLEDHSGEFFRRTTHLWRVECDVVAEALPGFALTKPPDGPLELRLPALGAVELAVLTAGEAPVPAAGLEVLLFAARAPGAAHFAERSGETDANGRVRFERIGCGLHLRVVTAGWSEALEGPRFVGPSTDGEQVTQAWRLPELPPRLRARLVDEAGLPLPGGGPLAVVLRWEGGEWSAPKWRIDEGGLVRIEVDRAALRADTLVLELDAAAYESSPGVWQPRRWAKIDLAGLAAGAQQLGDLVLPPAPLICAGTLRAPNGSALVEATLEGFAQRPPDGEGGTTPLWSARSRADGVFEVRVPPTPPLRERFWVRATAAAGGAAQWREIRVGDNAVEWQFDGDRP